MEHPKRPNLRSRRWTGNRLPRVGRGFSIVELLVVLVIIIVLIAILLPTISAVRRRSRIAVCASNLRQIGEALHSYRSEQRTWPIATPIGPPFTLPRFRSGPVLPDVLSSYLPVNSMVYHCPGDSGYVYDRIAAQAGGRGISYEYWIPFHLPKAIQIMMEDFQGYGSPTKTVIVTQFHPPHMGMNELDFDGSVEFGPANPNGP